MTMTIIRTVLGLLGFSASPVLVGAIVAGAITIGVGVFTLSVYNKGKASCEYGHLLATIKEKDRQLSEIEGIQRRDAARASSFEAELAKLQEKIDATPANTTACLDSGAVKRIRPFRGMRVQPNS